MVANKLSYTHLFHVSLDSVTKHYKPPTIQDAAGYDDRYNYGNESDEEDMETLFNRLLAKIHGLQNTEEM